MFICGIDENGRGSLLGPLVITAAVFESEKEELLKEIGVKDSKKISKEKREELYEILKKEAKEIKIIKIFPPEIDYFLKFTNLNSLEAKKISDLIEMTNADIYFIDSVTKSKKFKNEILKYVNKKVEIHVENYLDENNVFVAAASIIGKVERDREIEKLKEEMKIDFGSGYPSDQKTINFIKEFYFKYKDFPSFVRKSWITIDKIKNEIKIKSLKDFL